MSTRGIARVLSLVLIAATLSVLAPARRLAADEGEDLLRKLAVRDLSESEAAALLEKAAGILSRGKSTSRQDQVAYCSPGGLSPAQRLERAQGIRRAYRRAAAS